MLQYFDNILTVNSKDRYRISEGDGTMLMDYCDRVYQYEPELVKICRQYINEKKTFSAKEMCIRDSYSPLNIIWQGINLCDYEYITFWPAAQVVF